MHAEQSKTCSVARACAQSSDGCSRRASLGRPTNIRQACSVLFDPPRDATKTRPALRLRATRSGRGNARVARRTMASSLRVSSSFSIRVARYFAVNSWLIA